MEVGVEVVEAKEEDEEEEKKEKKEKEKEDNKIGVAEKSFHYCHAWCRFVIAILGLAKGVPFVDLFSCFFRQGFYKEISCLVIGSDFWNLSFSNQKWRLLWKGFALLDSFGNTKSKWS